jgi:hypothetical protein
MAKLSKADALIRDKAVSLSGLSQGQFRILPAAQKAQWLEQAQREAASELEGLGDQAGAESEEDDGIPEAVPGVRMVRDPGRYPEGPHEADVHPEEVNNYALGGWVRAD